MMVPQLWPSSIHREFRIALADRFFCPDPPVDGRIVIRGDEARHLTRVRRLGPGDRVEIFDGRSPTARPAEVRAVSGSWVELEVVGEPIRGREPSRPITLAVAVPKGERFDWLVEKAVEVGVARLVPLVTERSVVDPRASKLEKQRRAVVEASKQCGRNRLMAIDPPTPLADHLRDESSPVRLLAHPEGLSPGDWPAIGREGTAIAVGPEGGFTEREVEAARAAGWALASLGPTILRIETAAIVAAALAQSLGVRG
jgi:16S rRNA (uracil1498-N3)-methyltransferase